MTSMAWPLSPDAPRLPARRKKFQARAPLPHRRKQAWDGKQVLAHRSRSTAAFTRARKSAPSPKSLDDPGRIAAWSCPRSRVQSGHGSKMPRPASVDEARHFYVMRDYLLALDSSSAARRLHASSHCPTRSPRRQAVGCSSCQSSPSPFPPVAKAASSRSSPSSCPIERDEAATSGSASSICPAARQLGRSTRA